MDPKGSKTTEQITHFQCKKCKGWWSIGDAPGERELWYCPWCGLAQTFIQQTLNPKSL